MPRRSSLALVHPRTLPALGGLLRRALVVAGALLALLGVLYLVARETSLFALQTVTIQGASESVRNEILRETDALAGESLVSLDGGALASRLEALPSVRSVSYDRAFPHTLRLYVVPERPIAVVRAGTNGWVVSERGRVIGPAEAGKVRSFPRVRLPEQTGLEPGGFVPDRSARLALHALSLLPARFPVPVHAVRYEGGELTFVLSGTGGDRPELRLGEPADVGLKLAVGALVLRSLSGEERADLAYLDVSLPDRPVAGSKSQLST